MSSPLSNADESSFREVKDLMAISCIVVEFELELKESVSLKIPLEDQVTIIIDPNNLSVRWDYIWI
jgi:hypothetical protein